MNLSPELQEIFDKTVIETIDQIPPISIGFKGPGLDLKKYVDNEMDFYLGVVMATIQERYMCKVLNEKKFTVQDVYSTMPYTIITTYSMIPKLKEEIKKQLRL